MNELKIPKGYEIDLDNSKIRFKRKTEVKSWEELGKIEGFCISHDCEVYPFNGITQDITRDVFPTAEDAESAIALAQLLQLRKRVVGDWIPDWKKDSSKYVILRVDGEIEYIHASTCFNFLSFKTKQQAETFIKKHQELLNTYFQIK